MIVSNLDNQEKSQFPKTILPEQSDMEITHDLLKCFAFFVSGGMKLKEESTLKIGFVELAENAIKDMENSYCVFMLTNHNILCHL